MMGKRSIDFALLDDFSVSFARVLFRQYPHWESLATMVENSSAFEIFIPSADDPENKLWVSADAEEVIIGFDRWHGHFVWPDVCSDIAYQQALEQIEAFINEENAVQVFFRYDQWIGSRVVSYVDGLFDDISPWRASGATRTYRRSWLGSLNIERPMPVE